MLCGSCSYVCPSNIPLAQLFQASKARRCAGARRRRSHDRATRSSSPRRRTSGRRTPRHASCGHVVGEPRADRRGAARGSSAISALLVIAAAAAGALVTERVFGEGGRDRRRLGDDHRRAARPHAARRTPAVDGGARRRVRHRVRQDGLRRARTERLQSGADRSRLPAGGVSRSPITTWPGVGGAFWALRGDIFAAPVHASRADRCRHRGDPARAAQVRGARARASSTSCSATPAARSARRRRSLILALRRLPRLARPTSTGASRSRIFVTRRRGQPGAARHRGPARPARCSCSSPAG